MTFTQENSIDSPSRALLRTITCSELQNEVPRALGELLHAATEDGIFYLKFDDGDKRNWSRSIEGVDRLSRDIFDLSTEEKLLFDIDSMGKLKLNGYKPIGRNKGGIDGHRDGFESYAISQNTINMMPGLAVRHPGVVYKHQEALTQLTSNCLDMTQLVFKALSRAFGLPADDSFESRHHESATSSLDLLRLLKYPNAMGDGEFSIPQLAHADMGSLTFLFTSSPGLQILPPGTESWRNVLPMPGHAIVNFGDAIKILSGGKIESVVHRVVTMPGKQVRDRYSFAFLVRPGVSAQISTLASVAGQESENGMASPMTCEEWVSMRFSQLRAK
ncbi:oxidoreductase, 2OG-Fe(II) oxygenase family [Beauveria bassiana ARSEF 2860]|uniref:Oxidoreductase, 2OG-Fe(II) oxygenase family n=1 Tax=Beauveria bassiana (strain ARSEF 2860) TaxID=655819 RepID=J4KQ88_BEAB2|nr:oxidoreductase, 2OG-Fe(II) oxygenase family [Beauveria bassiana ARSEF 2860]EJP68779.1 oxidoreductase, 2OG-Fe(II) oxygenase family [Beauveria bassiana ARSEF 2860]